MKKPLLLLDLDTTLFKTGDFWQDYSIAFSSLSGKPADYYSKNYDAFTIGDNQLRTVDYDKMIADTHIAKADVRKALEFQMGNKSYLFEDADRLVKKLPLLQKKYDVAILTFGQPDFQNLKLEHTYEIAKIPVYITQQLKTDYISENFLDRPWGLLIDDKANQNLPIGWKELHIDRHARDYAAPVLVAPNVYRITTLDDVFSVLNNI